MYQTNLAKRRLRLALLLGAASIATIDISTQAAAQTDQQPPPPAQQAPQQPETIIVTGSILPQQSLYTPAPVTLITSENIENSGLTSATDVLRTITANNSGSLPSGFGPAFASGASNISLRGLESNATLVLINGERTVDYPLADDGTRSFVDLNTIPQDAIDHIEVLKDGASSIYGADAVAGVVNIIMRDSFEGAEGQFRVGNSEDGGGQEEYFAGRMGYGNLETDRFNAYIDLEWEHDNNIKVGQRDYPFDQSLLPGSDPNLAPLGGPNLQGGPGAINFQPSLTATVAPALIQNFTNNATPPLALGPSQPISAGFGIPGTCGPRTSLGTNNPGTPITNYFSAVGGTYCYQNNAEFYDIQPQLDKYNLYAHVTAKLWPGAEGRLDVSYDESDVSQQEPPPSLQYPIPTNATEVALPAYLTNGNANPNDPFVFGNASCAQTGQTEATAHSTTCPDAMIYDLFPVRAGFSSESHVLRSSLDVKGDYEGWNYDVDAVAAHTWLYLQTYGFADLNNELAAINNGTYNFVNPSANSQALLNSIVPPIMTSNTDDVELIDAHVTRGLFDLPGGPMLVGVGATIRHEQTFTPDSNPLQQQNLGTYQFIGERNVYSTYAEAQAPVLSSLEVDASGRYDHYTDAGDTLNPKLAAKWTPVDQISLRGTFSTGFVAPSFAESGPASLTQGFISPFTINTLGLSANNASPYCQFIDAHGGSNCAGGDAYVSGPYNLGNETVGNPDIKPQHSRSYTAGTILTPFEDIDLTATIDYYRISETDLITGASELAGTAAADYLQGLPLPAGFTVVPDAPDPLHPSAPLRPVNIIGTYSNQGAFKTDGMDFEVRGATDLPYGVHWTSDIDVTEIFDFWAYVGGQKEGWVGTMSPTAENAGGGTPRWSGSWTNTFTFDKLTQTFIGYYHSGMFMDLQDVGIFSCAAPVTTDISCKAKSYFDLDSTTRYQIDDHWEVFLTIRDILGEKPPFNPVGGGPLMNNEFDQEALVGRFFLGGVRVSL